MPRRAVVLAVVAALLASSGCGGDDDDTQPRVGATVAPTSSAPIQGQFDVGDRKLHIECFGKGSPTVVFQAGYPSDSSPYASVAREVGEVTRTCVYDRANLGRSDPLEGPRDGLDVVDDLETLLRVADVHGPYVLVGHSFGGVLSMLYATEHPQDLRGLVLLDAAHPDTEAAYAKLIPLKDQRRLKAEEQRQEPLNLDKASAQLNARLERLPDVPLTVITASLYDDLPPNWPGKRMQRIWLAHQKDYARMIPGARHVMADTHHNVHEEDPELVVEEITGVVRAATER